jgi:hypothetical protein
MKPFRLGSEWPDWWAARHIANDVTTHNVDGRWRGGPDYAVIRTKAGERRVNHGEIVAPEMFDWPN